MHTGLILSRSSTIGTIPMTLLSTIPVVHVVQPLCKVSKFNKPTIIGKSVLLFGHTFDAPATTNLVMLREGTFLAAKSVIVSIARTTAFGV